MNVYRDDRNFGTIDLVGVPFLVGGLAFDKKIAKYIMAVVVIIVNYILRKKIVFRKKRKIIEVDWKIIGKLTGKSKEPMERDAIAMSRLISFVPVYNEEKSLEYCMTKFLENMPDEYETEIIFVNDDSTDQSATVIKNNCER